MNQKILPLVDVRLWEVACRAENLAMTSPNTQMDAATKGIS
jgi:hypothetical protein